MIFLPKMHLLQSISARSTALCFTRTLFYSSKKGRDRDLMAKLQQPIDMSPDGVRRWLQRRVWKALVASHTFVPERNKVLGADLAAAHFVVQHGGAVMFEGQHHWVRKNKDGTSYLPRQPQRNLYLEAVDASNTTMMYPSFDTFVNLHNLKYLNVSRCVHIDDWCLDRFVQFRESLLVLDISGCGRVTERGLAALHKLSNLRRLIMHDMPSVRYAPLTALMLEDVLPQGCVVEGVDFTDAQTLERFEDVSASPAFLGAYEQFALQTDKQLQTDNVLPHLKNLNDNITTTARTK